ncbi:MAG: ABC transporter substrate-binding protein [Dongiaceae bacterium]
MPAPRFSARLRPLKLLIAALGTLAAGTAAAAGLPSGYPADYQGIVDAATKEGKVVIYSTTDAALANPLVQAFEARYPGIGVEYSDLNSTELYNRYIAEVAAGAGTGDLLWSSATDLQFKLVADGDALTYASPEIPSLPGWAVWKEQAYGTTAEPLAIVYNKRLVPPGDVPKSHADLLKLLQTKTEAYKGKICAYDPERSGVGFVQLTQDAAAWPQAWDLFQAFGKAQIKLYTSVGAMLERVGSGEHLIAYDVFGSYAIARAKKDPSIAWVLPSDFTLVTSRVAFISAKARAPNAAKLFLDFMLSQEGQTILAKADLHAIRADVEGEATAKSTAALVGDKARPIPIDDSLLKNLSPMARVAFIKKWQAAMQGG